MLAKEGPTVCGEVAIRGANALLDVDGGFKRHQQAIETQGVLFFRAASEG